MRDQHGTRVTDQNRQGAWMSDSIAIDQFLRNEGFDTPEAQQQARALLEQAAFTRPGKRAMSLTKVESARTLLTEQVLPVCGNPECERLATQDPATARTPITVSPAACRVCGGSNNRRAARLLACRLRRSGITRILVVGGTPTLHNEIVQLLGPEGLQFRFVDGSVGSHSNRDAQPNLQWAQVVVIWGASPLPHKVSNLYTFQPPSHVRIVKFARRGIEAMCREVLRSFGEN